MTVDYGKMCRGGAKVVTPSEQEDPMKPVSQRITVSQIFRITGVLGVVILFLIACLVGTVFVAVIIGLAFSKLFP